VATQTPEMRCPQCGGLIEAVEDDPFLSCNFCGARVFLDAARVVRHFIVEPRLDAGAAAASLARWLKGREVVGGVVPVSSALVFFPLWQVTIRGRVITIPAAGALYEGLDRLEVPAGDQKVFSAERAAGPRGEAAEVIEATVPLQAALARAAASASGLSASKIAAGGAAKDPVPAGAADGAEARLVHVPLHAIAYTYQEGAYRAAVDAASGQIHPVTAPRSSESRIDMAFAALLGGGLVLNLLALVLFRSAPLFAAALLGAIAWGLYAAGMRLARWSES
jgi:hypothetical protein